MILKLLRVSVILDDVRTTLKWKKSNIIKNGLCCKNRPSRLRHHHLHYSYIFVTHPPNVSISFSMQAYFFIMQQLTFFSGGRWDKKTDWNHPPSSEAWIIQNLTPGLVGRGYAGLCTTFLLSPSYTVSPCMAGTVTLLSKFLSDLMKIWSLWHM